MIDSVIQAESLTKCYGELCAVDNVSFEVPQGAPCGLLGGNGAGKTTTLSMLLGLLLPTSGGIRVLGEDMLAHRYRVLARMNFSSPYVDLPHRLTVQENLSVYARLYGLKERQRRIQRLAEELDIAAFLRRAYGNLSAGEKTRGGVAKAVVHEPDLLLRDEPR